MFRLMATVNVNSIFARAESHFRAGKLADARADLFMLQRMLGDHDAVLHLLGLVEKGRGDRLAALTALRRARELAPHDPRIANNLGNLLADMDLLEEALAAYDVAVMAAADFADARLNRAITLHRAKQYAQARADFDLLGRNHSGIARVWNARGAMEVDAGDLFAAAAAFDQALRIDPSNVVAVTGRARVALLRGEETASRRYAVAAHILPDDQSVAIGEAEALEAEGKPEATKRLAEMLRDAHHWVEGHATLSRMRWEAGETDVYLANFDRAITHRPRDPALRVALISLLAGTDQFALAADAAREAQAVFPGDAAFVLREAVHAGEAGDFGRAQAAFDRLPALLPDRDIHEARHFLRGRQPDRASDCLDHARQADPYDISIWSLTGVVWRLIEDVRAEWLYNPALMTAVELPLDPQQITEITALLRSLHVLRSFPIGQSLRGGTQTRGALLARTGPAIAVLKGAIEQEVAAYWQAMPAYDAGHPLLCRRGETPVIAGSWSVRLTQAGFHVAHIHPEGVLSSACYFVVPDDVGACQSGMLELGRPPADLRLTLPPLRTIKPLPGRMALFPSFVHHGTVPFARGERISMAFDVSTGVQVNSGAIQ